MDYFCLKLICQGNKQFTDIVSDIFNYVKRTHPLLGRCSIAKLENGMLSTYHTVDDGEDEDKHLDFEEVTLKMNTSISQVIKSKAVRLIDDISSLSRTPQTVRLASAGYLSSMTVPILYKENVIGVIFFNAKERDYFSPEDRAKDFIYIAQILSSRYIEVIERRNNFNSLLKVALKMGHHRDPETSQHLIRMGKYSEALARLLAHKFPQITTEFIHRIRFYAPFHDIGKYRIPDEVLFSDKKFSPEDREIMNLHPIFGDEIIDEVAYIGDLDNTPKEELRFVKNIIRYHHEAFDGSGYPEGLSRTEIPLEARIVTLADVFDALLSKRPYKEGWSMAEVIKFVKDKSGSLFDPFCVNALVENINEFLSIRESFSDEDSTLTNFQNHLVAGPTQLH